MQMIQKKVPLKIDLRADGTHESLPTAWELRNISDYFRDNHWRI